MKQVYAFLWKVVLTGVLCYAGILSAQTPPVNDDVCGSLPIPKYDTLYVFENFFATAQTGEDAIAPPTSGVDGLSWNESGITHSVWFTFVAPASGAVEIDLCNDSTLFDTQIAVYEVDDCTNFGTFFLKGANDDIDGQCQDGPEIWASRLEVSCLVPGDTYYLLVDGWVAGTTADSVGQFGVILSEIPGSEFAITTLGVDPVCSNSADGIAAVVALGGGPPYTYSWSTGGTTSSISNLNSGPVTVTVTDGCDSVKTATINLVDPGSGNPLVATGPDTLLMCDGGTVNLGDGRKVTGGVPLLPESAFALALDQMGVTSITHTLRDPVGFTLGSNFASLADIRCGDFAFGVFFGLTSDTDELVAINPTDGSISAVGLAGKPSDASWLGMAFDPTSSTMYASTGFGTTPPTLWTINLSTGAATAIDTFTGSAVVPVWLAINNQGNMYGGDLFTNELYSIDKTTANTSGIGNFGFDLFFGNIHDADFDPASNQLYMSVGNDVVGGNQVRFVDTTTGASILLGEYPGFFTSAFGIQDLPATEYEYIWTPVNFLDDFQSSNPVANPPVNLRYIAAIRDECGDLVRDTVLVFIPPALSVDQSSTGDSGAGDGSATITFVDGVPPYTLQWENGETTNTITGLSGDVFYSFTASDACGTIIQDSVFVLGTFNEELVNVGLSQLDAYPNPVEQTLFIELATLRPDDVQIQMLDAKGAIVEFQTLNRVMNEEVRLDMSSLSSGIYMLKVTTSEGSAYRKIFRK
ncbi:MAG: T9SS type A sorting domain-containing protein [Bacteroidota bacterium]